MTSDGYFSISMLDVEDTRISAARISSAPWVTRDRHDGHPDPLVVSPDYAVPQPGWFSLTAYAHPMHHSPARPFSTALRLWLSVVVAGRSEHRDPQHRYTHPSEDYLREITRQLLARERYGMFWNGADWYQMAVSEAALWHHHPRLPEHQYGDDQELITLFPCTQCT